MIPFSTEFDGKKGDGATDPAGAADFAPLSVRRRAGESPE
jgi:hypothetical protein